MTSSAAVFLAIDFDQLLDLGLIAIESHEGNLDGFTLPWIRVDDRFYPLPDRHKAFFVGIPETYGKRGDLLRHNCSKLIT